MKICVVIALPEQLEQAGVRIRYRRLTSQLTALGHHLDILPINSFKAPNELNHDIYLISKCYDSRSLVLAHRLSENGRLVGIDLFDDYFSQRGDSRLGSYRLWLKSFMRFAHFVLCSTSSLGEVARNYAPKLPVHILNDPSPSVDSKALSVALEGKHRRALETKRIPVTWFGIGDNHYFSVGLRDLVAFAGALSGLRRRGFEPSLEILTNRRALTLENLTLLRRLPLSYDIQEWTEERETKLLARSLACFLPVNAQNFSAAKSPNRAVTALSSGTQVISVGYPLYDGFAPFIYRDPRDLIRDIETGAQWALNPKTAAQFLRQVNRCAPEKEGERLIKFLLGLRGRGVGALAGRVKREIAVLFGHSFPRSEYKFAKRMKALRVALPFCRQGYNFDARFVWRAGEGISVLLARKHLRRLNPAIAAAFKSATRFRMSFYVEARLEDIVSDIDRCGLALGQIDLPGAFSTSYVYIFAVVERAISILFPNAVCVHSENSDLPWHIVLAKNAAVHEAA